MSKATKFKTVKDYFEAQPEHTKQKLLQLKAYILKGAPAATELLNYNMPAFALIEPGKREQQIMIAAYKNHLGFYPHPTTIEQFNSDLQDYKSAKGSVQFPLNKPLPKALIVRMVAYRLALLKKQKNQL